MKKLLFSLFLALCAVGTWARDFTQDGISYREIEYEGKTALQVIALADGKYSGDIDIPAQVDGVSVVSIGDTAFYACTNLTSVVIPNSVTSIGRSAFNGCSSLTSITIPNSVAMGRRNDFTACPINELNVSITSFEVNNILSAYFFDSSIKWKYYYNGTAVTEIPEGTTAIGDYALYNYKDLTTISIPNSVTSIGSFAFEGCSSLTSVTIPNSVTSIGDYAFSGCHVNKLFISCKDTEDFSNYISRTDCRIFQIYGTTRSILIAGQEQKDITIPNSVTSIGSQAFYACTNLTSMTIPNSVTSIGSEAFACCNVKKVSISCKDTEDFSNYVSRTDFRIFKSYGTTHSILIAGQEQKDITIPNSVTSIGEYAFKDCHGITSVTIPNSVTSIGSSAFSGCSGLTSVTIPNSVTSIGSSTFSGCSSLTSATIGNSVTSIGSSAFEGCFSLTSVTIPNSVTSIGSSAFEGCSSLTSVTIPNSVTSIEYFAFKGCSSLTSATIGNSVTSIESSAFDGCKLRTVIAKSSNPEGYTDVFSSNTYTYATLYVPEGSYWAYAYDCPWTFIHMKEMVNDAANVKQDMLYLLADEQGANYSVYDADSKEIRTIDYAHNLDEESLGTYWQILKNGSNHYLYNPAANMYGIMQDGKVQLTTVPVNIDLSEQDGTLTIGGSKCMLVLNTEMENPTGISTPTAIQNKGQMYDLQGRKISSTNNVKGIYIQDGKKILMK